MSRLSILYFVLITLKGTRYGEDCDSLEASSARAYPETS
jgi:hypothetical protein